MGLYGSKITDSNVIFRVMLFSFIGIAMFAILVSWRAQALSNAEYVEFPRAHRSKQTVIRPQTDFEKQQHELQDQLK